MKFAPLFEEKGLSLERLRTLVAVDEAGNIARVAPDDESRQSLISRQLTELERFFRTELKRKNGKSIALTPAGKELARLARQHLHSLEQFRKSRNLEPKDVTIGAGDSLLQWLVIPKLREIREVLRGSIIELQDLQNVAIRDALQDHVIDFGLLRSDLVKRGALDCKLLGTFGYSLFIPNKLWPRNENADEAELLQELPLVIQGGGTLFQSRLGELAAKNKWKLNINFLCESFPQTAQVLASGQMAAILPDLVRLSAPIDSAWVCPLKSLEGLRREICLAWHPHRLETRPHLAGATDKLAEVLRFSA